MKNGLPTTPLDTAHPKKPGWLVNGAAVGRKNMVIEKKTIDDRRVLLDCLNNHVFHVTTRDAFKGIQEVGEISNNRLATLPINTSSQNSYGRLNGYVCLFDLRNRTEEVVQHTLDCYYFLGPTWFMKHGRKFLYWNLVYLFLKEEYHNRLIPNSKAFEHSRKTAEYLQAIPDTEVWIDEQIPLAWVEKALVVKIREAAPDINTPAGLHYWAVISAS